MQYDCGYESNILRVSMSDALTYWYRLCPICEGQGRLFILENAMTHRLYLHCEECDSGWTHPRLVEHTESSFSAITERVESTVPTLERIRELGWEEYALHRS